MITYINILSNGSIRYNKKHTHYIGKLTMLSLLRKKRKSNNISRCILSVNSYLLPAREERTSNAENDSVFKEMLRRDLPTSVYGVLQEHWKRIGVD